MPYPSNEARTELDAAFDWWRAAGVDWGFGEEPQDWLRSERASERVPGPTIPPVSSFENGDDVGSPQVPIGGPPSDWPTDLDAFREWWGEMPFADAIGGFGPLVPPVGRSDAKLMLLADRPGESDREATVGMPLGTLVEAMLRAMRIATDDVYYACALPRSVDLPDWSMLARGGLGALLRHHVGLVGPARLIVLGSGGLSLLAHDMAQSPAHLTEIKHEGASVPILAAPDLAALAASPRERARFWKRWLDWAG